jgi:transposase
MNPAVLARYRAVEKKSGSPRVLAGPEAAQLKEPPDHAPGRSKGGFGTEVHLVCEGHGILLEIYVTPGQRHEYKVFEIVMERVLLPHHRGQRFWPERMAGDKGYSYPHVRRRLKQHGIRDVIPTEKNRPRDLAFEKAQYRRRNIVERVVEWFKECRRLGTRYEKLAVNYVAFWMVAMIEKDLRLFGFSDRA